MNWNAKALRRKGENELSKELIGAAIDVHRKLGPGLLDAICERCLCIELDRRGIRYVRQEPLPVTYKDVPTGLSYRLDVLVEDLVVLELKATEDNIALHAAQLLTYLKLTSCRLGLLINFGLETLRDGVERVVNGLTP